MPVENGHIWYSAEDLKEDRRRFAENHDGRLFADEIAIDSVELMWREIWSPALRGKHKL